MYKDNKKWPSLKEIEQDLFHSLQAQFKEKFVHILEEVDEWILEHRDHQRYAVKDKRLFQLDTVFGPVTMKRRTYIDRHQQRYVALLDQYLTFSGKDALSPFLEEVAVDWAVKGPSYRDAQNRMEEFLGYRVMSHERIRQKVLELEKMKPSMQEECLKSVDVLFLEVDGVHASLQRERTRSREVKVGIIHEGWQRSTPGSKEFRLRNKRYHYTLDNGKTFWEQMSDQIEDQYEITKDTYIVINGDAAPWIRQGVEYFPNALYVYDQYHLKKWIEQALRYQPKHKRRAKQAANQHDPVSLLIAVAEAEKAEKQERRKEEISALREFVLENQEAIRDYRERLREQGIDTTGMRPMGAAESNMNQFANRLKKRGYSWSLQGLNAMVKAIVAMFEGRLKSMLQTTVGETEKLKTTKKYSLQHFLKQKTQVSVGVQKGHMPVLHTRDQSKPYVDVLRIISGLK